MGATPPSRDGDVPAKATLFCPDCDHRSRPGGDWRTVETRERTRYRCPDCGAVVTVRPRGETDPGATTGGARSGVLRPWLSFWFRAFGPR